MRRPSVVSRMALRLAMPLLLGAFGAAHGAGPAPTVRLVVPSAAGSAPDVIARLVADELQARLSRTVVVENKPGAGGIIAAMTVKGAKPDGGTLLLAQAAVATVTPLTYRAAKYDMRTDFDSIAVIGDSPMLFVTRADGPRTLNEAIERARERPGRMTLGSPARGSIPHLSGELLAQMANAPFNVVPMSGSAQAIQAIVNGDSEVSVDGAPALLPLVRAGRLRALAATASRRLPGMEDLPLARDTVNGLTPSGWFMLFGPKGLPRQQLLALNEAVTTALRDPRVVQKLESMMVYPVGGSPGDASAFLAEEQRRWALAVQRAGLQPE